MDFIAVIDFGSQYAHLIAKRFRALGYYSKILEPTADVKALEGALGIVLSGGPHSIYDEDAPDFNHKIMELDVPILGLCYGHYIVQCAYGGKVEKAPVGEYGLATLTIDAASPLFEGLSNIEQVWQSHGDEVTSIAKGFTIIGHTEACAIAASEDLYRRRFSLQFHCEVKDTPAGDTIFNNFAHYCNMRPNWDPYQVLDTLVTNIKSSAGDKRVLLFLSGGVDSTVTFALLNRALGKDRVLGLHIDNGFMRKGESAAITQRYRALNMDNFIARDESSTFLKAIEGLCDPQEKRRAVGETFITVKDAVTREMGLEDGKWLLAQGTLYPDIIESGGTRNSNTIKTHHNRVAGIQKLLARGLVIEPINSLYKDEVRRLGVSLGLPKDMVMRHPFPGPGLSINVLCSKGILPPSEDIVSAQKEVAAMEASGLLMGGAKVLPVKSVGVQGDKRTYRYPLSIGYTLPKAGEDISWDDIEHLSTTVTGHSKYINRLVLCLYAREGDFSLHEGYCDRDTLDRLREVDAIVLRLLHTSGYYDKVFQHLTISLSYSIVEGHNSYVLRPVVSEDVMTARAAKLPIKLLAAMVGEIKALPFVDAIYYDTTNKPPATFGWE